MRGSPRGGKTSRRVRFRCGASWAKIQAPSSPERDALVWRLSPCTWDSWPPLVASWRGGATNLAAPQCRLGPRLAVNTPGMAGAWLGLEPRETDTAGGGADATGDRSSYAGTSPTSTTRVLSEGRPLGRRPTPTLGQSVAGEGGRRPPPQPSRTGSTAPPSTPRRTQPGEAAPPRSTRSHRAAPGRRLHRGRRASSRPARHTTTTATAKRLATAVVARRSGAQLGSRGRLLARGRGVCNGRLRPEHGTATRSYAQSSGPHVQGPAVG